MSIWRVQVELQKTSLTPEDIVVNTWHVDQDTTVDPIDAQTPVLAFYNAITNQISDSVARTSGAHRIKIYDLSDPTPRVPISDNPWTLQSGGTGDDLPPEIACCVSFQASPQSGIPQGRRRGRVYIGPLKVSAIDEERFAAATLTLLANAAETMANSLNTNGCPLGVYSPTDAQLYLADEIWVDDAIDIQRRRGVAAVSRTVRTI